MPNFQYYQNVDGSPHEKPHYKNSAYWNEGKWGNYIEPLLPEDCSDMTFVDMGCNAGLFLKLAKDRGFKTVIGVEKDKRAYRRAVKFRDDNGYDYQILHREIGRNFDFDEIPLADITLISNVHYYIDLSEWLKYLDILRHRTTHCLIISREVLPHKLWKPKTLVPDIQHYFREWEAVDAIYKVRYVYPEPEDTAPRVLWSFLFKSGLQRRSIESLRTGSKKLRISAEEKVKKENTIKEFIDSCVNGTDVTKTDYYKFFKKRITAKLSIKSVDTFIKGKIALVHSLIKDGQKDPVLIDMDNKLADGGNRVLILKDLGYKSVITRRI